MTKEARKLTKEDLENIDLAKSEFIRAEIEEMDKRAANIKMQFLGTKLGKN